MADLNVFVIVVNIILILTGLSAFVIFLIGFTNHGLEFIKYGFSKKHKPKD